MKECHSFSKEPSEKFGYMDGLVAARRHIMYGLILLSGLGSHQKYYTHSFYKQLLYKQASTGQDKTESISSIGLKNEKQFEHFCSNLS